MKQNANDLPADVPTFVACEKLSGAPHLALETFRPRWANSYVEQHDDDGRRWYSVLLTASLARNCSWIGISLDVVLR